MTRAIELKNDYTIGYTNRWMYAAKSEHERAILDYNKAIQLSPNYAAAYYNRGLSYSTIFGYNLANEDATEDTTSTRLLLLQKSWSCLLRKS